MLCLNNFTNFNDLETTINFIAKIINLKQQYNYCQICIKNVE